MSKLIHRETSLIRVSSFGKKKNVSRNAVWMHIKTGLIETVLIGMDKEVYIDWKQYKNYQFNENFKRR